MGDIGELPRVVDARKANDARLCDYALGGKDNFAADRQAAEALVAALPETRYLLPEWHRFRRRALRAVLDAGVRQFLDLGCGMPTRHNVHDTVAAADPAAPVVCCDIDAVAVTHFKALMSPDGPHAAFQADVRDPAAILDAPEVRDRIDLARPVGLIMTSVLHLVGDEHDPERIVARLRDALAPGSHLVLCNVSGSDIDPVRAATYRRIAGEVGIAVTLREHDRIAGFFDGFDLLDPGLVHAAHWRPDRDGDPHTGWVQAGVGRKP